jgi:hypothetical protein
VYLLFFLIGVTKDDDLAIVGQPKNVTVEVTEESSMNSSSREVSGMRPSSFKDEERSTTGAFPEEPPLLKHR